MRNKAEKKRNKTGFFGAADVNSGCLGIERRGIDGKPSARMNDNSNGDSYDQRERRNALEINQRFDANLANFLEIGHSCDALDEDTENHRRDHHANESDEDVAKRPEGDAGFRRGAANENTNEDGDEDLNIKDGVPRLACARRLGAGHAWLSWLRESGAHGAGWFTVYLSRRGGAAARWQEARARYCAKRNGKESGGLAGHAGNVRREQDAARGFA